MKRLALCLAVLLALAACGDVGPGPGADRFNARFHYFYSETCDYDINGPYNCSGVSSMGAPFTIGLKITHDGYATLRLDDAWFYYSESEYSEGYDGGQYFYQFYDGHEQMTVFDDGTEAIFLNEWDNIVIYYYADLPF